MLATPRSGAAVRLSPDRRFGPDIADRAPASALTAGAAVGDQQPVAGNALELLVDGPNTCAAMLKAIADARDHVHLESYIVSDDEVGNRFAAALRERAAAGVTVRLVYDAVGSLVTPRAWFDALREAGVRVIEYNPVIPLALERRPWRVNARDHRKLLVVDGQVAFVGGVNLDEAYSCDPPPPHGVRRLLHRPARKRRPQLAGSAGAEPRWRDTHLKLRGPVVAAFQRLFLDTWHQQGGDTHGARGLFPAQAPAGPAFACAIASQPLDPHSPSHAALEAAIHAARHRVWITNAYFVPAARLRAALCAAATRGADVRLILPSHTDSTLVLAAGRAHYTGLLRAGVRIHERQGAVVHCKTATVDGLWSTVGSSNLDWRSLRDNAEINAVVLDRDFAAQMEALYREDMRCAREITLDAWRHRPWPQRCAQAAARLLERFL